MPKKGDVVFFHARDNFFEEGVALFSHAKHGIVHVAIWVDEDKTVEANLGRKIGYATISEYEQQGNKVEIKTLPQLTDEQRDKIVEYLLTQFGRSYDIVEIVKLFFKFFSIKLAYQEHFRRICSSLVYEAYKYAGVLLTDDGDDSTPEEVYDFPYWETAI